MVEIMEHILYILVEIIVPIFELIGLGVVAVTICKAFLGYTKSMVTGQHAEVSLSLDEGMSLALGFLMGAEILKTILIRDISGAKEVGAIFALRALMSLLLHFEMKQERTAEREKEEAGIGRE